MSDAVSFSLDCPRLSPFYGESHDKLRALVKEWMLKNVKPHHAQWEKDGRIPMWVHESAAKEGFYAMMVPKELGGILPPFLETPDIFHHCVVSEELTRYGSGFTAALMVHGIGLPPILRWGTEEQKRRIVPVVARGEAVISLGITEPSGGSDVMNLQTVAKREGDYYIVNGQKTLITGAPRARWITCAVRTGKPGLGGLSFLIIDTQDTPGFTVREIPKQGWLMSDTGALVFENARVPVANRIGREGAGFMMIMQNFNTERLGCITGCLACARVLLEESIVYARQRKTFGKPVIKNQGIQWKLLEVARQIESGQAMHDVCAWNLERQMNGQTSDPLLVAKLSLAKVHASRAMELAAREAQQVFGGKSFIRGAGRGELVERLYRERPPLAIGGGSEEIMLELAGRQAKL